MAIEKLDEFAKDGQKNTDGLTLTDGFPVLTKPARQWFNWLFNTLSLKINEMIDADYLGRSELIDNLTTNDATKPLTAKQGKVLQDNKLEKSSNLSDLADATTARTNLGIPSLFEEFGLSLQPYNMVSGELIANLPRKSLFVYNRASAPIPSDSPVATGVKGFTIGYYQWNTQIAFGAYTNEMYIRARTTTDGAYRAWSKVRSEANTTVDSNGFIKNASPIVNLYADRIELNDEAQLQSIELEKLGVGDYLLKGSTGFALEGWYVEQPKDVNGNIFHAVVYEQLVNGDLSIKTYAYMQQDGRLVADLNQPVDVKENRFISIRMNSLPEDPTAPTNPTIVDNKGNPAPSNYHVLENGVWVISEEDNGKWQAELYALHLASFTPLTRYQFFRALLEKGYKSADIEAQIQTIEDDYQRELVMLGWQMATNFVRTDESVILMQNMLGWSDEQVEQMWTYAMTL